ncbi:MAG TPA: hypothetical protein VFA68_17625 [Terriglobales bacterium]|nr:hypothetical protein [Terriglobales bacterium]
MITTKAAGDSVTFQIDGALEGDSVGELERRWRQVCKTGPYIQLDLCRAANIDEPGKSLIAEMFANGVEVVVGCKPTERVQ